MKIFTQTYDLAKASPHRFWVAPFSEFKIGIKILEKDEISSKDFTLKAGSIEFTPDEDKIDNFTLYTIKSNDTGFVEYTIEVEGVAEKLKLTQIVTDSTVFEIDAGGGDVPADVATQSWVNSQISDFVEEDALTAYYTKNETSSATEIGTALEGKQPAGNYLTAETEPAFAAMSADIVVDGDLTAYYTKSETSSATELADAFAGAGGGSAISAFDMSENPVMSKTLVNEAARNSICLPQTLYLDSDGNVISVHNLSGAYSSSSPSGSTSKVVNGLVIGTQITAFNGLPYYIAPLKSGGGLVLPNTLKTIGNGAFNNTPSGPVNNWSAINIPDSVTSIYNPKYSIASYGGWAYMDFGNTRTSIPQATSTDGVNPDCRYYVPDALYDTWVETSPWSKIADQIHRHSELEAPYLYQSKVTGGAETGTTGTPAAITAVKSVYETDWATLSATADANTFYVVLPDPA